MDKPCNICKHPKPLTDYYKKAGNSDGRKNVCKTCENQLAKEKRAKKDSETIKAF
jgi:hypothetical protein